MRLDVVMAITTAMAGIEVVHADSLEWLAEQEENSIDAVLTDPPYGLEFMGKEWDGFGENAGFQEWCRRWGELLFRAMKPGAYALVFGGTRTITAWYAAWRMRVSR